MRLPVSLSLRPRRRGWQNLRAAIAGAALAGLLAGPSRARAESITVEECLRETAAHNPAILAQQRAIEAALGSRLTLRARALPTLVIGGIAGYQGARDNEVIRATATSLAGVNQRSALLLIIGTETLTQPIFDVSIPPSWRRGTLGILAAQENYYAVAASILNATRNAYYRALYQERREALLHEIDHLLASNIDAQNTLVNAGLRGRQPLLSAEVQRANFDPSIQTAAGTYRSSLAQLLALMGREPGPGANDPVGRITLEGELAERPFDFDAAAVAQEALANRPDIRYLRAQTKALVEDAKITRGGYYPRLQLFVDGELVPQDFVKGTNPNAIRASDQIQATEVRPGISGYWSVIDTGVVQGEAHRLDAVHAELETNLHKLESNIPSELAAVRAMVQGSAGSLDLLRGNVTTAQNTLDIVNRGIQQGLNSQLEFIDAQSGLLSARIGLLDSALNLSLAYAEFDRVSGRYLNYTVDDSSKVTAVHVPASHH